MPRRRIKDTPTTNPYMWDDVVSYWLWQDGTGIELEDNSGYYMSEAWNGSFETDNPDSGWDVYGTEVETVRLTLRRS
jgi:hypothetical protein